MSNLLLHPVTKSQLATLEQAQTHAVLISGPSGSGKYTVAREFITSILNTKTLDNHPYFLEITAKAGSIGIDDIRRIVDFLKRKTSGKYSLRRAVLIADAEHMTIEAQNSLLKTLEEPPSDTLIALTVSNVHLVRPTIRSRVQHIMLQPLHEAEVMNYFSTQGYEKAKLQTAYYMSDGRIGLLAALLDETKPHELVEAISAAKKIMTMSAHERLLHVDAIAKDKVQLGYLLEGLERLAVSGLRQAASKPNTSTVRTFYRVSSAVARAKNRLEKNVNPKLLMCDLFLQI